MNVTYIILIYAIICICMIIFNASAIILGKGNNKINNIKLKKYKEKIKEQFVLLSENKPVTKEHKKYLKRKLLNSNNFLTYDNIVTNYIKKEEQYIKPYLDECREVFEELLYKYDKKNNIEKAFCIKSIKEYGVFIHNNVVAVEDVLFENLNDESIYCRDNAYLAICSMEEAVRIIEALKIISNSEKYFHKNIITIGLNSYQGNSDKLLDGLFNNFSKFSLDIKCCIIEYATYFDNKYSKHILELLLNKKTPRILKINCIKYFEYVYYKPAGPILVAYTYKYLDYDNDMCYHTVKSLRNYESKNSIKAIEKSIYSADFRIRDIACESLAFIRLGLDSKEIDNIFEQESEILEIYDYHFQKNRSKSSGEVR